MSLQNKRVHETKEHELTCINSARRGSGSAFQTQNDQMRAGNVLESHKEETEGKLWSLFKMPFWQINVNPNTHTSSSSSSSASSSTTTSTTTSSSSLSSGGGNNVHGAIANLQQNPQSNLNLQQQQQQADRFSSLSNSMNAVSLVAKSLLPARRRLRLDPPNKLYFPYEPGKQVKSAIGIKNFSKSHIAFKFQTTSPKSCYMRPPGRILAPGEGLIATVFKFVEPPENNERPLEQKSRVKFKIMSLKVKRGTEYIPEMFDELKDQVAVEQILRVIFLDPESPCPALDKLKQQLAEAEAEVEARKKPAEVAGPQVASDQGLVIIDEWKERRERYLAQQQVEADSE